jgi:hypothetical protein
MNRENYKIEIKPINSIKSIIPIELYDKIISHCKQGFLRKKIPKKNPKACGILTTHKCAQIKEAITIADVYPLYSDVRNDKKFERMQKRIEYIINKYSDVCPACYPEDRGFIINPEELFSVLTKIEERSQDVVAIYHMHCCNVEGVDASMISKVDIKLHVYPKFLIAIVDMRVIDNPQIRVFKVESNDTNTAYEIPVIVT